MDSHSLDVAIMFNACAIMWAIRESMLVSSLGHGIRLQ